MPGGTVHQDAPDRAPHKGDLGNPGERPLLLVRTLRPSAKERFVSDEQVVAGVAVPVVVEFELPEVRHQLPPQPAGSVAQLC